MPTETQRLAEYGGRRRVIDGHAVIELVSPQDNARTRYQYRRRGHELERRLVGADGVVIEDWAPVAPHELRRLKEARGVWHPILDPLGFGASEPR